MNEKQTNTRTASRNLSIAPIIDGWMKTIRQIKRLHEIITPQKVVGGGGGTDRIHRNMENNNKWS